MTKRVTFIIYNQWMHGRICGLTKWGWRTMRLYVFPWPLRVVRLLQNQRRRIFGKEMPHWLKDALKVIKYVSLLQLVPTLHMVAFYPRHFFKVLPQIVGKGSKARPYYLTPVQFLGYLVVLQGLAIAYLPIKSLGVTQPELALLNLGLVLAFPFVALAACLVVLLLWFVCAHVWPINYVAQAIPFNIYGALLPLDPSTYVSLNWSRYLWSMFYYYLYFYLMVLLATSLMVVLEVGIFSVHAGASGRVMYFNKLTLIPYFAAGLIVALAGYYLFVRPYIVLLLANARYATTTMMKYFIMEQRP